MDAVVAIIAALTGGALSAFGAWLAIGRQLNHQHDTYRRVARDFFSFICEKHSENIQQLIEFRSAKAGYIDYIYLEAIRSDHQMLERNREQLVWVDDRNLRTRLLNAALQVSTWADQVRNAALAEDQSLAAQNASHEGSKEYIEATNYLQVARNMKDRLFEKAPLLKAEFSSLAAVLNNVEGE